MRDLERGLIILGLIFWGTYWASTLNPRATGVYDELIGPDQVPHHELIEAGFPFTATRYWTRCTTGGGPYITWLPLGVLGNCLAVSIGLGLLDLVYLNLEAWIKEARK